MTKNSLNLAEKTVLTAEDFEEIEAIEAAEGAKFVEENSIESTDESGEIITRQFPKYQTNTFSAYFGIESGSEESKIFHEMSDLSKYLGFFFDHITGAYVRITPRANNPEAEFTIYSKKAAQDLVRNKVNTGVFSTPELDTLRQILSTCKNDDERKNVQSEIAGYLKSLIDNFNAEPVVFVCDPNEKPIKYIDAALFQLNLFRPTPIYRSAMSYREMGVRFSNFSWLEKTPHVELLLRNLFPKESELEYFLNWLAAAFASGQHLTTIPVVFGIQGTGKDTFFSHIVEHFFGERYTMSLSNEDLISRFMPRKIQSALFIRGDEIMGEFSQKSAVIAKLKQYSGNGEIRLELKNFDSKTIRSKSNMIIFSNDTNPVTIERSDRRFSAFQTAETPLRKIWESLGISMEDFFRHIDYERDSFLKRLVCFDFSISAANIPFENAVRERIKNETNMKIDVFSDNVQKLNLNFSRELGLALVGFFSQDIWDQRLKHDVLRKFNLSENVGPTTKEEILMEHADAFWERLVACVETHGCVSQTTLSVAFRLFAHTREKLDAARANRELERFFQPGSARIWDFETQIPDFSSERKKTRTWTCAAWLQYAVKGQEEPIEEPVAAEPAMPQEPRDPAETVVANTPEPKPLEDILAAAKATDVKKYDENGNRIYPLDSDGNPIISEAESNADLKAILGFS